MEMSDASAVEFLKIPILGFVRKDLAIGAFSPADRNVVATRDASSSRFCLTCMALGCEHMRVEAECRLPWLNWREIQIIRRLAMDGCANKIAAFELGLTGATVKMYLFQIGKKLRAAGFPAVKNRVALVTWSVENLPAVAL